MRIIRLIVVAVASLVFLTAALFAQVVTYDEITAPNMGASSDVRVTGDVGGDLLVVGADIEFGVRAMMFI